jgi:hypothetical protein
MSEAVVPQQRWSFTLQTMPAPAIIPVRRTEEEAGYVSFRPVVRQNFSLLDLLGLVLGVTGKHPERVRQIMRTGSVSFHAYHYSWSGFHLDDAELAAALAPFPDPDPARAFRLDTCIAALLEGGSPLRPLLDLERDSVARKGWFRGRSFWDVLLTSANRAPLAYHGYSYQWRADLHRLVLSAEEAAALSAQAQSLAPRDMRRHLLALDRASHILFVCRREIP